MHFLAMHDTDGLKSVHKVCRIMTIRPVVEFIDSAGLIIQRVSEFALPMFC